MFITNNDTIKRKKETTRVTANGWTLDITYLYYFDWGMAVAQCGDDTISAKQYQRLRVPKSDEAADWEDYEYQKQQFIERVKADFTEDIKKYVAQL